MSRDFTKSLRLPAFFIFSLALLGVDAARSAEVLPPASERFADADTDEVPSLQRHVLPLMGRLGCNGRACHGSFQGQGGFRLSLFGYDFKTDHEAIVKSEEPRVDLEKPKNSLILSKPSSKDPDEHGGGKRMDVGSWQYRLIQQWVKAGAPAVDEDKDPHFVRMDVTPTEIVCRKVGESTQLKIVAYWSDGSIEDVTPLCRFTTNDDAVAQVDLNGKITCVGKGDTHVVAFYDNGVVPVSVMLPVSEQNGKHFPAVAANTEVDELVVAKLRKLGVVPSDVCSDTDFLRRVSLDITGQLPSADEVKKFLADKSKDKRSAKVDELLERPAFAAWWATKFSDILGNSENQLRQNTPPKSSEHWYRWLNQRLLENTHYDDLVERVVLAKGRSSDGQTFEEYCDEITSYVRKNDPADFTDRETMPYYWMRRNMRTSNEKALSFSYAFLGVRLQCAECHKHPFDQWSQSDFQHFTAFFNRITSGPIDKKAADEMVAKLGIETDKRKVGGAKIRQQLDALALKGQVVPFEEVYIRPSDNSGSGGKKSDSKAGRVITPKVLGGDEVVEGYADPRQPLMDWLRQKDNPYFARSMVNRVWAHYFNVGIVEPADDMNLANAPSNKELLDYLSDAFIEHDFDIRWLMREIVNSDTYQRSWHTNATNEVDLRNFSHAVPRRLPAEVVYDAVVEATAGRDEFDERFADPIDHCAIGLGAGYTYRGSNGKNYALSVFGKPKRETPCDCERSNEPSLLQTVFLRNDQEMFDLITRRDGWLAETVPGVKDGKLSKSTYDAEETAKKLSYVNKSIDGIEVQLLDKGKKKLSKGAVEELKRAREKLRERRKELEEIVAKHEQQENETKAATPSELVVDAYLRTFSRYPSKKELASAEEYLNDSTNLATGIRDLVWALLNTKEFVVNH